MGDKIEQGGFEESEGIQLSAWSKLRRVVARSTPSFETPAVELPKGASFREQLMAAITRSTPAFRNQKRR